MQRTDLGHGRGWLDAAAAASLARVDRALGHPIQVTEAGRTGERQQELRDLYEAGKGNYAAPRGESPHEDGNAIDTNERLVALLAEHGWKRTLDFEPWHFVYNPARDQHRNDPAPTGNTTTPNPESEEDDMPKNSGFIYRASGQKADQRTVLICNYGSGIFHEYTNGIATADSTYNAAIAKAFDTTSFAEISASHADSIKKSLKA